MSAKRLLKRIVVCVERTVAQTGDADCHQIAGLIEQALANEADRADLILGLAEYLAAAVNGATIQLDAWTPTKTLARRARH